LFYSYYYCIAVGGVQGHVDPRAAGVIDQIDSSTYVESTSDWPPTERAFIIRRPAEGGEGRTAE
jgi:hypothetical protein